MAYNPFRNFGLKTLSVAIAVMLWFLFGSQQIVERSLRSPLELQNKPENLELVGEAPASVDVRVRGTSGVLGQLSAGDIVTVLDLTTARSGRRLFHLTPEQVRVPFGVEVTFVGPATMWLAFERSMTKVVPVDPTVDGQPAPGYEVEGVTTEPKEVEIVGPETAVRDVKQAITEPVQIEGATVSIRESVTIGTPNNATRLRVPRNARVVVDIVPVRTERTIVRIPVRMQNLRPGLTARSSPSLIAVTARGAEDVLARMSADDFETFVDLSGLGPGRYTLPVRVAEPPGLAVVRTEPSQVEISIR
ncbi:MAG: CdaR family protein [Acidobacteriota bacterium]